MRANLLKKAGVFFAFQLTLLSIGQAQVANDKSHLFAAHVNQVLTGLKDTKYQAPTEVDAEKGVFRCNCSGLISHILRHHFPESYLTVRGDNAPWKVRPLAVTFYETFVAAGNKEGSKPGWQQVPKLMDVKPGDIIAWRKSILKQGLATGHICMIASLPVLEADGRVKVRVVDSTSGKHANDTRPEGVTGVGSGDMWFSIDEAGEPVGYWYNENSKKSRSYKIAVGRVVPIKVSGSLHPNTAPTIPALVSTSPDLDFVGLSQQEAIKLATSRKINHRLIVTNETRMPVSKVIDDSRVNFVVKNGKVIRTIRG